MPWPASRLCMHLLHTSGPVKTLCHNVDLVCILRLNQQPPKGALWGSTRQRSDQSGLPLSAETKDWQLQAREVTAETSGTERYRSLAIHAEVKLAEALERCLRVSPAVCNASGEEKPNKLRTAVCCQLLGEFADMCGPLSGALRNIRDELVKSVYSSYYISERGLMMFDQLPWFSVAERLETEKEVFVAERENFKSMLAQQQDMVAVIEDQLASYKRSMQTAQLEAASLHSRLEALAVSEESCRLEAKTGREELKKVRKEVYKMKDELDAEKAGHAETAAKLLAVEASIKMQVLELTARAVEAEDAAAQAWQTAEMRLPPEVIEATKTQLDTVSKQLLETQRKVRELELLRDKLGAKMESMTPRPTWKQLKKYGVEVRDRTQETVLAVGERLVAYQGEMDELAGHVALLYDAMAPDPAPREVQLTIITESSSYFITEGTGGQETVAAKPKAVAEPLGSMARVPRCLRARERVEVEMLSVADTEALVASIWRSKALYDAAHTPESLQTYLYHYFAAASEAAAAASGRDSVQLVRPLTGNATGSPVIGASGPSGGSGGRGGPGVGAGRFSAIACVAGRGFHSHGEVLYQSYSLYHALATHGGSSPSLALFRGVLFGHLSEAVHRDQQAMVTGLCRVLRRLAEAVSPSDAGPGRISVTDMASLLERLFPERPPFRLSRLSDAFTQQFLVSKSGSADSDDEAVPLATLLAALQPHSLMPPLPVVPEPDVGLLRGGSVAAQGAAMAEGRELGPVGPVDVEEEDTSFVTTLLEQHLQEVTTLVEQVASSLDEVPCSGGGAGGNGTAAARTAKAGATTASIAWSTVPRGAPLESLCAVLEEHVGEDQASSIVGLAFGLPHGTAADALKDLRVVVAPGEFRKRVLSRTLVKPATNFDVDGALRWCNGLLASVGAANGGSLPEVA